MKYTGLKSVPRMTHNLGQLPPLDLPAKTVTRLQKGVGRIAILVAALTRAGYELRPAPETLANRASRRTLAVRAGLARDTVMALACGQGTVASYLQLAKALKVTPRIAERKSYAACLSSRNQTWQTPPSLLAAILAAGGRAEFDPDPCSSASDGPVPALTRWTEADDGLSRPWCGTIFVNPPYSRALPKWVAKCAAEADVGAVVIGLVPSRTDTQWWHDHVAYRASIIMLKGRLRFSGGAHAAPFPSAIVVWGDSGLAERIAGVIPGAWLIPARRVAA